jgi:hypothetical protein
MGWTSIVGAAASATRRRAPPDLAERIAVPAPRTLLFARVLCLAGRAPLRRLKSRDQPRLCESQAWTALLTFRL